MNWLKKNKYGARKSTCKKGDAHPSALEAAVCNFVHLRLKDGEFVEIREQVKVELCSECRFATKIDFMGVSGKGRETYIEAKGDDTIDRWRRIRREWKRAGPAPLEVWGGSWQRPILKEIILPPVGGADLGD